MASCRRQPAESLDADTPTWCDLGEGAFLDFTPRFVPDHEAWLDALLPELDLEQETIVMFGRDVLVPRLVGFYGEPGRAYRYSGRTHEPTPWTPHLARLRRRVVEHTGTAYNTVLANLYRDGGDSMGRHSDDERELGPHPDDIRVASLTLGATRKFRMTRRADGRRIDVALGHGALLVMGGTMQRLWTHEVPRTKAPSSPRLNLTFRCVG